MRLHHPHGEYGSTRFWITDFPVWDVGSNTSSDQDDQKTDFLSVQRRDFSRISAGPLGSIPQIFNRYRSVKLKGITGLTFFYGFDGVRSPLAELVDIHSHTERAPYAAMSRDSRHSARRAPFRWVYVPIADNDQIEELAVLHLPSSMSSALRPIILVRIPLALNSPTFIHLKLLSDSLCRSAQSSPRTSGWDGVKRTRCPLHRCRSWTASATMCGSAKIPPV